MLSRLAALERGTRQLGDGSGKVIQRRAKLTISFTEPRRTLRPFDGFLAVPAFRLALFPVREIRCDSDPRHIAGVELPRFLLKIRGVKAEIVHRPRVQEERSYRWGGRRRTRRWEH